MDRITRGEALKREKERYEELKKEYFAWGSNSHIYPCVKMGEGVRVGSFSVIGGFSVGERHGTGGVLLEDDVNIGDQCCIQRGLYGDTTLRKGCWVNQQCNVGHDCVVGKYTILRNNVVLLGQVEIGERCDISCGVRVREDIKIGDNVFIAMGATVVKDVPDNSFVMSPVAARVVDREMPPRHPRHMK